MHVAVEPHAAFWQPADDGAADCTLCYRRCHIVPGAAGHCQYRCNEGGRLVLVGAGDVSRMSFSIVGRSGENGGLRWYKPGALIMNIGLTHCTAACTFCWSRNAAYRPGKLPQIERPPSPPMWYNQRLQMSAAAIVKIARQYDVDTIALQDNEPTLTIEHSQAIAKIAQQAGIAVAIFTNGFSTSEAIQALAPFTDIAVIGVKGSADETFYAQQVRAPGAVPAVLDAIQTWHAAGVRTHVVDLIAPPHLQTDTQAEAAQQRLYRHIAETVGPLATLDLCPIHDPRDPRQLLLPRTDQSSAYTPRLRHAREIAHGLGLSYASYERNIHCHACGGLLLHIKPGHDQHATAGHCDHCGAVVPLVTLDRVRVMRNWTRIAAIEAIGPRNILQ